MPNPAVETRRILWIALPELKRLGCCVQCRRCLELTRPAHRASMGTDTPYSALLSYSSILASARYQVLVQRATTVCKYCARRTLPRALVIRVGGNDT